MTDASGEEWKGPNEVDSWSSSSLNSTGQCLEKNTDASQTSHFKPIDTKQTAYVLEDFSSSEESLGDLEEMAKMAKIGESPSNFVRIPSACARKNLGLNPNAFLGGEKVGFPGPASEIKSVLLSHTAVQNVFIAGKHSKAVRDANRVFAQAILGHRDMHQCNACARYFNCKRNLNEHF